MSQEIKKISDLLTERMSYVSIVASKVTKYLDTIQDTITGINAADYKLAMENISSLKESVVSIPQTIKLNDSTNLINEAVTLYENIDVVDAAVHQLIGIFENPTYSKLAMYNMSTTYTVNMQREKNIAYNAFEKYTSKSVIDNEIIINIILDILNLSANSNEIFMFVLNNENIINKFTIKLIGALINVVSGEKHRRLELLVEKQKDTVIKATRIDISAWRGVQGMVVRYGLRPVTKSMPLSDLFNSMNIKYNAKHSMEENIKKYVCDGHGIIVINRANASPVEFDLRGIADANYIVSNNLETNPISGLTKKIVDKFQTAKLLPKTDIGPEIIAKYPGKLNTWRIIETINGELYRALGHLGNDIVPGDQIVGLLNGISTRCYQYNLIQSNVIITKCLDARAESLVAEYDNNTTESTSGSIVPTITDKLQKSFEKAVKDHPVKNILQFKKLVMDKDTISKTLLEVLKHSTGIYGKGSTEYLVTYLAKFDVILRKFYGEVERQLSLQIINSRMFAENTQDETHKILGGIYKAIVTKSANELDKAKMWSDYDLSLKEYFLEKKQIVV